MKKKKLSKELKKFKKLIQSDRKYYSDKIDTLEGRNEELSKELAKWKVRVLSQSELLKLKKSMTIQGPDGQAMQFHHQESGGVGIVIPEILHPGGEDENHMELTISPHIMHDVIMHFLFWYWKRDREEPLIENPR